MIIASVRLTVLTCLFATITTSVAAQQPLQRPPQNKGLRLSLGAGVLFNPVFDGDNDYQLLALPSIRAQYGTRFVASVREGARYYIVQNKNWSIGPIARLSFKRDEEDGTSPLQVVRRGNDDLLGLGDIDFTVELGGYAQYRHGNFAIEADARQAISGHDGFVSDINFSYRKIFTDFTRPVILSTGPRLRLADSTFVQSFYGITEAQSAASGLAVFDASGGFVSAGVGFNVIAPIDDNITMAVFGGYDRLLGDAKRSPLVQERGSPNQFSLGIFFSYSFDAF